jgi:hypothetical protein
MLKTISNKIKDVLGYIQFLILRKLRLKQAKKRDPNVYPLY